MDSRETSIATDLRSVIGKQLDIEPDSFADDASFTDDLGADSLAVVELLLAFEERFDISIPEDHAEQIKSLTDAVRYLRQRLS